MSQESLLETRKKTNYQKIYDAWNEISGIRKVQKNKISLIKKNILHLKKKISIEDIIKSFEVFSESNVSIFNIDKNFLTLNNFLKVNYDDFQEINFNNRYEYIGLNSESLCLDCLSGEINKYKKAKKRIKPKNQQIVPSINSGEKYFLLTSGKVGDHNWKLQRFSELLSQVYLEYLQNKDNFSFENPEDNYLDNVLKTAQSFLKFIEYNDTKINLSKIKSYYYISERPFRLFPILRRFLRETYEDNFVLSWVKSMVFRKQFKKFLIDNNYFGELKDNRFPRNEYRKIAKDTNRLFFGNILDTPEFKAFIKRKDKVEVKKVQGFDFSDFTQDEIEHILAQQTYDETYKTSKCQKMYSDMKASKSRIKAKSNMEDRERKIIRHNWEEIIKNGVFTNVFPPCHYVWKNKVL